MTTKVTLSDKTKTLIKELKTINSQLIVLPAFFTENSEEDIELATLIEWMQKNPLLSDKKSRFLIQSIYVALLEDIRKVVATDEKEDEEESAGWSSKFKFIVLAIAGTIFFGCEGFDGITAIAGIFSLPTVVIFAAGLVFSVLSIVVFCAFDLVEISNNLGFKVTNAPQIVDLYLNEIEEIKAIRRAIGSRLSSNKEIFSVDMALILLLKERYAALDQGRTELESLGSGIGLRIAKFATAGVAGIIFFSGGFFAGQTVALAIASLFVASTAATFWPVLVASIVVGLAALSVYWFVERPGIENLISRWAGLDQEKINTLCDSKAVMKEKKKLTMLETQMTNVMKEQTVTVKKEDKLVEQRQKIIQLEDRLDILEAKKNVGGSASASNNRNGFLYNRLSRSQSYNDLPKLIVSQP